MTKRKVLKLSGNMVTLPLNQAEGPYLGLTEEQFLRFRRACHAAWETISADVCGVEGVPDTMPRSDVIEIVLDADYLKNYGGGMRAPHEWDKLYKDVINPWITKNYDTPAFNELMKKVFPYERYATS